MYNAESGQKARARFTPRCRSRPSCSSCVHPLRTAPSGKELVTPKLSVPQSGSIPVSYRGYRIQPLGAGLAVPELELAAATPQALYREVNTLLFRALHGGVDVAAEKLYATADRDGDGLLSGDEIDRFVRTARPGERGVDISGLLSYWGVESLR